jgi:hypothetical protein
VGAHRLNREDIVALLLVTRQLQARSVQQEFECLPVGGFPRTAERCSLFLPIMQVFELVNLLPDLFRVRRSGRKPARP